MVCYALNIADVLGVELWLHAKRNAEYLHGRCCGVVRSNSAGTERLSTGLKQQDGETGVGRQRALRPGLMNMMRIFAGHFCKCFYT